MIVDRGANNMKRWIRAMTGLLTLMVVPAAVPKDEASVSEEIEKRTGHALRPVHLAVGERASLPPGVSFDDGISEDEAVDDPESALDAGALSIGSPGHGFCRSTVAPGGRRRGGR